MMYKRTLVTLAATGLLLTACGASEDPGGSTESSTEDAQATDQGTGTEFPEMTLRMESPVGIEFPWSQILVQFGEGVAERTNGTVQVEVFPNLELSGDNVTQFENIQLGTIDGAAVNSQPLTAFDERLNVFSLPFIASSAEEYYALLDGPGAQLWDDVLSDLEVVGIPEAITMDGFRQLTNSGSPVTSVEDVAGLTLRTPGLPLYIDIFEALGANPTSIPFGELAGALQQGVVDGQENPLATIKAGGFADFQDNLTIWNYSNSSMVFAFNPETWEEAGPDLQQIFKEEALAAAQWHRDTVSSTNDEVLKEFTETSAFENIVEFSDAEYAEFRSAMEPVVEAWRTRLGADVVEPFLVNWSDE